MREFICGYASLANCVADSVGFVLAGIVILTLIVVIIWSAVSDELWRRRRYKEQQKTNVKF